jgi:hypothetical protein
MASTGRDAWHAATAAGLAGAARNASAAAHAPATRHPSAARCRWVAADDAPGPAGLAAAALAACSCMAGDARWAARRGTLWVARDAPGPAGLAAAALAACCCVAGGARWAARRGALWAAGRLACSPRRPPAACRGLAGPIGPHTPAAPGALAGGTRRGTLWVARDAAAGCAALFTRRPAARDGVSAAASRAAPRGYPAAAAHRPARTSRTATSTAGAAGAAADTACAPAARAAGGRGTSSGTRWVASSAGLRRRRRRNGCHDQPSVGARLAQPCFRHCWTSQQWHPRTSRAACCGPTSRASRGGIDRGEAEAARGARAHRPIAAARAKPRDCVAGFARGATATCGPAEGRTAPGRAAAGARWGTLWVATGSQAGCPSPTEGHSAAGRAPGGTLWVAGGREVAARRAPTGPPRCARQTGQD